MHQYLFAASRSDPLAVARLGRHELLDGREDDATAGDAELLAQVGAARILGLPAYEIGSLATAFAV